MDAYSLSAFVLGITFTVAAVAKALSPNDLTKELRHTISLSRIASRRGAYALIGTELVIGALVMLGIGDGAPASAAFVLLSVFSYHLLHSLVVIQSRAGCSCFGPALKGTSAILAIARNVLLGVLAFIVATRPIGVLSAGAAATQASEDVHVATSMPWLLMASSVACGIVLIRWIILETRFHVGDVA